MTLVQGGIQWLNQNGGVLAVMSFAATLLINHDKFFALWERVTGRQKITVSRSLVGIPEPGNSITIANHSGQPIMISHWALVLAKGVPPWLKIKETIVHEAEWDSDGFTVASHSREKMDFSGDRWFDWGWKIRREGRYFLKVWFEGRKRPRWFHVHTPGK